MVTFLTSVIPHGIIAVLETLPLRETGMDLWTIVQSLYNVTAINYFANIIIFGFPWPTQPPLPRALL